MKSRKYLQPIWATLLFSPVIPSGINFAEAEYKGVKAGWCRKADKIEAYIDMPEGFNGHFEHDGKKTKLHVGRNEFSF